MNWLMLILGLWALGTALILGLALWRYVQWRRAMTRTLAEIRNLPE